MAWSKYSVYTSTFYTMYTLFLLQAIDILQQSYTKLHRVTPSYTNCIYRLFFVKACLYSANSFCLTLLFRQLLLCARQLMKQNLSGMSNDILSMHGNVCLLSV